MKGTDSTSWRNENCWKKRERENGRWTDGRTWMCGSCWIGERIYDRLIDFIIVFLRKLLSACEITDWPKRLEHVTSKAKKRKRREKSKLSSKTKKKNDSNVLESNQLLANKTKNQSQIRIEFKENESKTDTTRETLLLFNTARFFFLFLFSLTKNSDAANWRSTAQNQPSANCYLHLPKLNENSICLVIMITTTATSVYNGVLRPVKKKRWKIRFLVIWADLEPLSSSYSDRVIPCSCLLWEPF